MCGEDTGVPFYEPIYKRAYYIDGCGQLCHKCYNELQFYSDEGKHRTTNSKYTKWTDELRQFIKLEIEKQ